MNLVKPDSPEEAIILCTFAYQPFEKEYEALTDEELSSLNPYDLRPLPRARNLTINSLAREAANLDGYLNDRPVNKGTLDTYKTLVARMVVDGLLVDEHDLKPHGVAYNENPNLIPMHVFLPWLRDTGAYDLTVDDSIESQIDRAAKYAKTLRWRSQGFFKGAAAVGLLIALLYFVFFAAAPEGGQLNTPVDALTVEVPPTFKTVYLTVMSILFFVLLLKGWIFAKRSKEWALEAERLKEDAS